MKVQVKKSNKCEKTINVKIDADRITAAYSKYFNQIAPAAKVKGFRQGKVPRQVLESHFQKEAKQNVLEHLINESYREVVLEHDVHPIQFPKIHDVNFNDNELSYTAIVEIRPEIKLPKYKGLKATREVKEVTDKEVDDVVQRIREQRATFAAVEDRAVQAADFVVYDVVCKVEDQVIKDQKDQWLEVGGAQAQKEFSDQLVGAKVGDKKQFNLVLPETYHEEQYRGKQAQYDVSVKEIKEKKLPDMDEAFLKGLGDFQSDADLKRSIRKDLEENAKQVGNRDVENDLIEQILKKTKFELPVTLLEDKIKHILQEDERQQTYQGAPKEELDKKLDERKKIAAEQAEKQLRGAFVLSEIAKVEKVTVTDQEIDQRIAIIARQYGQDPKKIREFYEKENHIDGLANEIQTGKVIQFIRENAEIKDKVKKS